MKQENHKGEFVLHQGPRRSGWFEKELELRIKHIRKQWPAMPGSKSRDLMMYESFERQKGWGDRKEWDKSCR